MKPLKTIAVHTQATFLFLCCSALFLQSVSADDQFTYLQSYCSEYGHYDRGTEYESNLNRMLYNLDSKSSTSMFDNSTVGEIHGLFRCNTLNTNQICHRCVQIASGEILRRCPSSKDAIVWYTQCMIRYANDSIVSINDVSIYFNIETGPRGYDVFDQKLSDTFIILLNQAATGNLSLMSASTSVYVKEKKRMSCYVDCTPDISQSDCHNCLQTGLSRLRIDGSLAGALLQPSCQLTYAFTRTGDFLPGKGLKIALSIISAIAGVSLLFHVFICINRRKRHGEPKGIDDIESMENIHFEFEAIKAATGNFSTTNKIGQGGFGVVYMGTLADGKAVAVKRLSKASRQGIREFKTEACLAAKLQHKNLVKLFGFCSEGNEMLLVYEFVSNMSLDRYLFDTQQGANLKWETRYNIIVGITRGLLYLHEDSSPKIIHRDLKPSNILLDGDMNPKISDFGMAKLFEIDQTQGDTSRVAGTYGYMAPEYAINGHFSVKSDIFSYGVIILEIISGKRNNIRRADVQDETLLNYAWRLWSEGDPLKLVDSTLGNDFSKLETEKCIQVGLLCTQEDEAKRPNIESIWRMFNTRPVTIPPPASPPSLIPFQGGRPSFSHHSNTNWEDDEDVTSSLCPR